MGVLMECGHTAQGTDKNGNPVCVICYGLDEGATKVAEKPDLAGRKAICSSCKSEKSIVDSDFDLPFFELREKGIGKLKGHEDKDRYYCGCRGWD